VNNYRTSDFTTPQGGYKESGWGRENGTEAIEEYLETKAVWIELDEDPSYRFQDDA
jgi:aldehyde dehydrogenase (NAD+)